MTAFIGVRISWLMVARKTLFARFASSAWRIASRNWRARRSRSVMSIQPFIRPSIRPWRSL